MIVTLARKPVDGTVAANAIHIGLGGLNVHSCRISVNPLEAKEDDGGRRTSKDNVHPGFHRPNASMFYSNKPTVRAAKKDGRWPANVLHDGSTRVLGGFKENTSSMPSMSTGTRARQSGFTMTDGTGGYGDTGSTSRYFKQIGDTPC